ncbi:hypothetical protein Pan153_59560 [Gimesia panareensis]|uniref:HNH endonuclease n=1 Tax=Gimesia panareensis TaxID=2527978 RepID=A0A518FY16_9PLAN|nr:HNH endonuclease [Gimesia panareensis]QDV21268.1 hypothetical protein Pan153_59560 [Gimesia panareensis]
MRFVVWMQRRLIRELCKLPENTVVDCNWLKQVWRKVDGDWVDRFWGQVNKGPRNKAIKMIAAAPVDVKLEIKQIAWQHFQIELYYTGHLSGRLEIVDWGVSDAHKAFKKLMTSFYEDWLRKESIPTPHGDVSTKTLYSTGLASSLVCPYCDNKMTDANRRMDHFFPDSKFPALSVSLTNLIPACETCNGLSRKHNTLPCSPDAAESLADWFHPHFRSGAQKITVQLSGASPNLRLHVSAISPTDQPKVDTFVSCVKLDWAENPERDVRSYKRDVVVGLFETPASKDAIVASLKKWASRYAMSIGEEPEAIKKHGCFESMVTLPAIIREIEEQLIEDQKISASPSNGTQRKA